MKNTVIYCLVAITMVYLAPKAAFAQTDGPKVNHVAICTHNLKKSVTSYTEVIDG